MELRFHELSSKQQCQARAMYIGACHNDGYWYMVTTGKVLYRTTEREDHEPIDNKENYPESYLSGLEGTEQL